MPRPYSLHAFGLVRLCVSRATINRYGFNSLGADAVQDHLLLWEKRARENPELRTGMRLCVCVCVCDTAPCAQFLAMLCKQMHLAFDSRVWGA